MNVSPSVEIEDLRRGQEVMLNEALNVVDAMEFERAGDIVTLKEILEDGERALVIGHTDEERVVRLAEPLLDITIRPRRRLLLEPRSGYVYEVVPKSEVEELVLEEVPDIDYDKIGGLGDQIELIRDAVELPLPSPPTSSRSTSSVRPRASCSTDRPAAARHSSPSRRQLPGEEGRRGHRTARRKELLPQHQGPPRAPQQVRRRDRAPHPPGLPACP